ncbi:MAG: arsenite methyltransferase [Thermoguttaceae bacterium]
MSDKIIDAVRSKYASVAQSDLSSRNEGVRAVAEAFGYSKEELGSIPAEANMGLSCGNPTAYASLKPGEVVVDLGCGGGLDVFLAAAKVGASGRAIGIDMTQEMIDRARANAARGIDGNPVSNAEFHLATIDKLPLPDASVDCVISNCVINLAPDKRAVFREVARVLKPGGRLAVSDLILKKPLPPEIADDVMAYVGCIAGAISAEDYRSGLLEAGFAEVQVADTGADLNAYTQVENQASCCSAPALLSIETASPRGCCGSQKQSTAGSSQVHSGLSKLLTRHDVNEYAASARVFAVKPN